jgi:hypothetical protein
MWVEVSVRVTLRLVVYRQSVFLCTKHYETHDHYFFNWSLAVIALMLHPLRREDGSLVYNFCWCSPAQSFSSPRPARLMTIFYCLRLESPPTWRVRSPYLYPPGTRWTSYAPRHWVPFSSPPTTRRDTVGVFNPASIRGVLWRICVWLQTGFGLVNRFIDHLQVVTTNSNNTIPTSTLYIALEHTVYCSQCVTRRFLVTAPTMAIPLPPAQVLSWQTNY